MEDRFDKRQNPDGLWEIYDTENEEVLHIDGLPLTGLDIDEADEVLARIRRGELSPDSTPETP